MKAKTTSRKYADGIGARVKMARVAAGKSQTALGRHLGVSFQQVQKYENGTNRISAPTLAEIAKFLGIPVFQLFAELSGGKDSEALEIAAIIKNIPSRPNRRLMVMMVRGMAAAVMGRA